MSRFLLAWELGGDLGHVRRQLAIARGLKARGHEAILALRSLDYLGAHANDEFEWVQAPRIQVISPPDPSPLNASDILATLGFGDVDSLAGVLTGWSALIRLFEPAAIVGDYAPAAMLAAHRAGLPRICVGSGFSSPKLGDPMPALRPWIASDPAELARRDARLVASVRQAFERIPGKAAAPAHASEVFRSDADIVCTWPEVDPFGPRDDVVYAGPQDDQAGAQSLAWRPTHAPRIVAYLKPREEHCLALVEAIRQLGAQAVIAIPGIRPDEAAALTSDAVRVLDGLVDLALLAQADLCIGHAGAGLVSAATAHGVPMALLPTNLEQFLIARRAEQAGRALVMHPDKPVADFRAWLQSALDDPGLRSAARSAVPTAPRPRLDAAELIERVVS